MRAAAAAKFDDIKAQASPKYAAARAQARADMEVAKQVAATYTLALTNQWVDVKEKIKTGVLSLDYSLEAKLTAFGSYTLSDLPHPPLPLHTFFWLWVIFFLYLYSAFVSLPTDPLVAGLHGYVNFVFIAAGGVGTLMLMRGYTIRAAAKFHPMTLEDAFSLPAYKSSCCKAIAREFYLSAPHLLSIGGMLLGVTFIEVVLACYAIPQFVVPSNLTKPLSDAALLVLPASVLLLLALVLIRAYAPVDLVYQYSAILGKDVYEADFKAGTAKGARFCVLGFGLGMLFLNGALYKAQWALDEGVGLPAEVEARLLPLCRFTFQLVIWFFIPICFVGLTAIVSTIKRGLWVYPAWGKPNPLDKEGKPLPTYERAAAKAYAEGTWAAFQKGKARRGFGLWFCSTAVLCGVCLLIPPWAVFYAATETTAVACDVALETRFLALETPVGEVAKSIADGIIAGIPQLCTFLEAKTALACPADVPLDGYELRLERLDDFDLDLDKACGAAYTLNFWMKTMLFGLLVHLPAAMVAWHLINRYTMLMHLKDINAGRTTETAAKKALV